MQFLQKIKQLGLRTSYSLLFKLSRSTRLPFIIKLKLAAGLALLGSEAVKAQTVELPHEPEKSDTSYLDIEMESTSQTLCYEIVIHNDITEPRFKGGWFALNRFIQKKFKYPEIALKNNIEGFVTVELSVDENGNVTDASIFKGLGFGIDEEVLRVVHLLPKFKPGKVKNKKAEMNKTIIIEFKLPKE